MRTELFGKDLETLSVGELERHLCAVPVGIQRTRKKIDKATFDKEVYAVCAFFILEDDVEEARVMLLRAALLPTIDSLEEELDEEVTCLLKDMTTDEGLIRRVSENIPCQCLEELVKTTEETEEAANQGTSFAEFVAAPRRVVKKNSKLEDKTNPARANAADHDTWSLALNDSL